MEHAEIASLLHERFGVPGWWTQMVTVGYEQSIGKPVPRQKVDGFAASASKTLNVSAAAAFRAFNDPGKRAIWLTDAHHLRGRQDAPRRQHLCEGRGQGAGNAPAHEARQRARGCAYEEVLGDALKRLEEALVS